MKWINFSKCSKYYLLNRGLKQKNTNKKSGRSILIFTKCNRHYSLSREGLITKKIQNTQLTRRAQVFISWYPLIDRVERKSFWYKCWFTYIFANINYPCISISCISQRPGDKTTFLFLITTLKQICKELSTWIVLTSSPFLLEWQITNLCETQQQLRIPTEVHGLQLNLEEFFLVALSLFEKSVWKNMFDVIT